MVSTLRAMRAFKEKKTKANDYVLGAIPETQWRSKMNAAQIINCQQENLEGMRTEKGNASSLAFTVDAILLDCE